MEDTKNQYKDLFLAIGLDPKTVDSITKNHKVSHRLKEILDIASLTHADKTIGNLFYYLTTK